MSNFDPSRLKDMQLIDDKLHDKRTSRRGKRLLERSRAAILRQERDPDIKRLRSQLLKATQANDAGVVTRISEQLQKYDQRAGFDQREA